MNRVWIDLETSGLSAKNNSILEIACLVEKEGKIVAEFESKMKPWEGASCHPKAMEVNGITDSDIESFPENKKVFDEFNVFCHEYIRSMPVYGYRPSFDVNFLIEWFMINDRKQLYYRFFKAPIDVLSIAVDSILRRDRDIVLLDYKLKTVLEAYRVQYDVDSLHGAMSDIKLTRELYLKAVS